MAGVTIVAATREAEGVFPANTALGQTLAAYAHYGISTRLFYSNTRGLPERYNRAIDETTDEDEIPIFCTMMYFSGNLNGRTLRWGHAASALFMTAMSLTLIRRKGLQGMRTICRNGDSELVRAHR
jgi:hypothetical protein